MGEDSKNLSPLEAFIGDDYLNWTPKQRIFIAAPTGTGKTTFVVNTLLNHVIELSRTRSRSQREEINLKIVYICNRRALRSQVMERVRKVLDLEGSEFDDINEFNLAASKHFVVTSYQALEKKEWFPDFEIPWDGTEYSREEWVQKRRQYSGRFPIGISSKEVMYYIFDEAHYFLCDSSVNSNTNFWNTFQTETNQRFQKTISIFMTATPEPLYTYMARGEIAGNISQELESLYRLMKDKQDKKKRWTHEYDLFGRKLMYSSKQIREKLREIRPYDSIFKKIACAEEYSKKYGKIYRMEKPSHYDYLHVRYFHQLEELVQQILQNPEERWAVFVDNIQQGEWLCDQLNQKEVEGFSESDDADIATAFFLSAPKIKKNQQSKVLIQKLSEMERIRYRVLICTSVLDNGVDIVDRRIKNVAAISHQKTTFLQMIGRRRVQPGEEITLYIKCYDPRAINCIAGRLDSEIFCALQLMMATKQDLDNPMGRTDIEAGLTVEEIEHLKEKIIKKYSFLYAKNKVFLSRRMQRNRYISVPTNQIPDPAISDYQLNRNVLLSLLLQRKYYEDAREQFCADQPDPLFFLKYQLSWLGKSYDPEAWLSPYIQDTPARRKLTETLSGLAASGRWLDQEEQNQLRQECTTLLARMGYRKAIPSESEKKKGAAPLGHNALLAAFAEEQIPFTILCKQRQVNGARSTYWMVCPTESP